MGKKQVLKIENDDIVGAVLTFALDEFSIHKPRKHEDEFEITVLEKLSSIETIEEGLSKYEEDLEITLNPDQLVAITDLEDLEGFTPSKIIKVSSMGSNSIAVDLIDGRTYRVFPLEEEQQLRFPRVELSHGLVAYQI